MGNFNNKELTAFYDACNGYVWQWISFAKIKELGLINLRNDLVSLLDYSVKDGMLTKDEHDEAVNKIFDASDDELKDVVMKIGEFWGTLPIMMPYFPSEEDMKEFGWDNDSIPLLTMQVETLDNLREVLYGTVIEDYIKEFNERLAKL